jgi:DNA-binding response OmpR family regulator
VSFTSKPQVKQDYSSLTGVRVLLVEDTWHIAKALKSELEQVGMEVSGPAATTMAARCLIAEQMPRLAVVDVNLKRELACGLIEELHHQGVSVVVVSGYGLPPISSEKTTVVLQKPVRGPELLSALCGVLAQTRHCNDGPAGRGY